MASPIPAQQQLALESSGPNVEDLYLESYAFTTAAALVGSVDRKIFVLLRDGRKIFGVLRTFDQFANLLLQDSIERIYLNEGDQVVKFGETYRGVFMVRGENVVMMGELDIDREDDHLEQLQQISFQEAEAVFKANEKKQIAEEKIRKKKLAAKGLVSDFAEQRY